MSARPKKPLESKMGVSSALKRAAKDALELARCTRTPCYVMEGNKIVDIAKRPRKKKRSA
jgi:hypothetical protein